MDSQVLKYADNVKYLGFTFSTDQKDDNDILRQLRMLYTKSNRLVSLFHHCPVVVKVALLHNYCTCFYSPFRWALYKYRVVVKLSSLSSASTMYVVKNADSFEVLIRKRIIWFYERIK